MSSTMQAITVPAYGPPSTYTLSTIPVPTIKDPNDVLVAVHAASVNPIDVKKAAGALKMAVQDE